MAAFSSRLCKMSSTTARGNTCNSTRRDMLGDITRAVNHRLVNWKLGTSMSNRHRGITTANSSVVVSLIQNGSLGHERPPGAALNIGRASPADMRGGGADGYERARCSAAALTVLPPSPPGAVRSNFLSAGGGYRHRPAGLQHTSEAPRSTWHP